MISNGDSFGASSQVDPLSLSISLNNKHNNLKEDEFTDIFTSAINVPHLEDEDDENQNNYRTVKF